MAAFSVTSTRKRKRKSKSSKQSVIDQPVIDQPADKTHTMSRYLAACESMINAETKVLSDSNISKKDSVPAENVSPHQVHKLFYDRMSKDIVDAIDQISLSPIESPPGETSCGKAKTNILPEPVSSRKAVPVTQDSGSLDPCNPNSESNLQTVVFDCDKIMDELPVCLVNADEYETQHECVNVIESSPSSLPSIPVDVIDDAKSTEILVPDSFTLSELTTRYSDKLSAARPFITCDFFNLGYKLDLIADSGASINVLQISHFNEIDKRLKAQGLEVARIPSEIIVSSFGGQIMPSHGAFLAHISIGPGGANIIKNVAFMIISSESHRSTGVLGMPFIQMLNMSMTFYKDHCLLTFSPQSKLHSFKAILKGRLSHRLAVAESIEVLPRRNAKLILHFESCPNMPTSLDGQPLHLTNEPGFNELNLDQVVESVKGKIRAVVFNEEKRSIYLNKDVVIGNVFAISDYYEDYCDLSAIDTYIDAFSLNVLDKITCLCSEEYVFSGILIPILPSGYSNLGSPYEWKSPFQYFHTPPQRKRNDHMRVRGDFVFLFAGQDGKFKPINDEELEIIKRKFMLSQGTPHLCLPALNYKFADEGLLQTATVLRNNGFQVTLAPFLPSTCERCVSYDIGSVLPIQGSYKMKTVSIILPSKYGVIPAEYDRKLKNTKIHTWKIWDLTLDCYLQANRLVIIGHFSPPHLASEKKIVSYFTLMFSMLKPIFPHSRIEVLCASMEGDKYVWAEPIEKAWDKAKALPSYTDTSLDRSRKRSDSKEMYDEGIFVINGHCSCLLCASPQMGPDKTDLGVFFIVDSFWPMSEDLEQRLEKLKSENDLQNKLILEENVNAIEIGAETVPMHSISTIGELCEVSAIEITGKDENVEYLKEEPRVCDDLADFYIPPNPPPPKIDDYTPFFKLDHLSEPQRKQISILVNDFPELWATEPWQTRWIKKNVVSFEVKPGTKFYEPSYPLPAALKDIYNTLFDLMIERGMIVNSASEVIRPVCFTASFLVPRCSKLRMEGRTGPSAYRVVHNFSKLNLALVSPDEGHKIPSTADMYTLYSTKNTVTSVFDIHSFFNSHLLAGKNRKHMGLSGYDGRSYCGISCLLGLACAPGLCSVLKEFAIRPSLHDFTVAFVDDVTISTWPKEAEHRPHLELPQDHLDLIGTGEGLDYDFVQHIYGIRLLLTDMNAYELMISPSKCSFLPESYTYLGWECHKGTIKIPSGRFPYFQNFDPKTCDSKGLSQFLGCSNWVSSSIEGFSSKAALLYHKISLGLPPKSFKLSSLECSLVEEIKSNVLANPIRYIFDLNRETVVFCDSSGVAAAACWYQWVDGRLVFVEAISHKYSAVEIRSMSSLEKEAGSLLLCLGRKSGYFLGKTPVILYTDMYLVYWLCQNPEKVNAQSRLGRWIITIAQSNLNFKIQWISSKNKFLKITDSYSREDKLNYCTRFSNRLNGENESKVPIWEEGAVVTTAEWMSAIMNTSMVPFPKTAKDFIWNQHKDNDPFYSSETIEKMVDQQLLPKISFGVLKGPVPAAHAPPVLPTPRGAGDDAFVPLDEGQLEVEHLDQLEIVPQGGPQGVHELAMFSLDALHAKPDLFRALRKTLDESGGVPYSRQMLLDSQSKDEKISKIITALLTKSETKFIKENFVMVHGILARKTKNGLKIMVPFDMLLIICSYLHLWGHMGESSLARLVSGNFYNRSITAACKAICAVCKVCLFSRQARLTKDIGPGQLWRSSKCFFTIHIDFIVMTEVMHRNVKYSHVLNIVDNASKACFAVRTHKTDGETVATLLENVFSALPAVTNLFSDSAQNLTKAVPVAELLKRLNVRAIRAIPRAKEGGGFIERQNGLYRELSRLFQVATKTKNWAAVHPQVCRAMMQLPRKYFTLDNGVVKAIWQTPCFMAFQEDKIFNLDDIWCHPDVTPGEKKEWKDSIYSAIRSYDMSLREKQRQMELGAKDNLRLTVNSICVLKKFSNLPKREITHYVVNLWRVLSRNGRMVKISSIYGDPQIVDTHVKLLKPVKDSTRHQAQPFRYIVIERFIILYPFII